MRYTAVRRIRGVEIETSARIIAGRFEDWWEVYDLDRGEYTPAAVVKPSHRKMGAYGLKIGAFHIRPLTEAVTA